MTDHSASTMCTYQVRVDYLSEGAPFASETFLFDAADERAALQLARHRTDDSLFLDEDRPDLARRFTLEPYEPDDPDPASPGGAALKPVCRKCGCDGIVCDAAARWDEDGQCWSLSGTYDDLICDLCGAEGDDIADWVVAEPVAPSRRFLWDIAVFLRDPDLPGNPEFEQFSAASFDELTVEQAAAEWLERQNPPKTGHVA